MNAQLHQYSPQDAPAVLQSEIDALAEGGYRSSYGVAPNRWAAEAAKAVVGKLPAGLEASRVVPMADGGIGVVFLNVGTKAARVDISNDEEVVVTLKASPEARSIYREVAPNEVIPLVEEFLRS